MMKENIEKFTRIELRYLVFICMLRFCVGTGIDLFVPSLPAIKHYFHTNSHLVQLTICFYLLGYGIGQLFLGVVSDRVGRKKVLLFGEFCFALMAVLAVFAPTIYLLIIYRFLQGVGIAGMSVVCRSIPVDMFAGKKLKKVLIYVTISWALGPIIAPFIGGYLQYYFNWQASFWAFAIVGALLFIYTFFAIAETHKHVQLLQLKSLAHRFATILTHPLFVIGSLILVLGFSILLLFSVLGPFLIQSELHRSSVFYGHMAFILGVSYFVGTLLNRVLVEYFTTEKLIWMMFTVAFLVCLMMLIGAIIFPINVPGIVIPIALIFFCCAIIFTNILVKVLSIFKEISGTASAIFGCISSGGAFVVITFGSLVGHETALPLAVLYTSFFFICIVAFLLFCSVERQKNKRRS